MSEPGERAVEAISFDLFGTLVSVSRPEDPAARVARCLREQDVAVPDDWAARYGTNYADVDPGVERPLTDHVLAALGEPEESMATVRPAVERAIRQAFDAPAEPRPDVEATLAALASEHRLAVLSNCSVAGLVERSLETAGLGTDLFDAVIASVDCGWRKPHEGAFRALESALELPLDRLVHVGDTAATDGGATAVGARYISIEEVPIGALPEAVGA